jgi:hypothetical protein
MLASLAFATSDAPSIEDEARARALSADGSTQLDDIRIAIEDVQVTQDPLHMGAMLSSGAQDSLRHCQEKKHLMKRMDRKSGKWGTSHPRYRLLEALWGYYRYRERNMAELNRWRTLYKSVSKKQKRVCQSVAEPHPQSR